MKYEINLESLFSIQDDTANKVDLAKLDLRMKGQKNKEALLKIALPFYHSVLALHNRKCSNYPNVSTGQKGLLGLSRVDIQKKLNWITETDYHNLWSYNYSVITLDLDDVNVKIWLHNDANSNPIFTPLNSYSIQCCKSIGTQKPCDTYHKGKQFADSFNHVLREVAEACQSYRDDWKK